jgi:hypothetical protein
MKNFKIFLTFLTFGNFVGIIVGIMRLFRRISVKGFNIRLLKRKMEEKGKGLVLISDHPSMTETFVIPGLFCPRFIFDRRLSPISTPDSRFFNAKWFAPIRPSCISVPRGNRWGEAKAALMMKKVLAAGGTLILFGGGGREYKGEEFVESADGKRKMRKLKRGLESVLNSVKPLVLPVWTEGGENIIPNVNYKGERRPLPIPKPWKKMSIIFGDVIEWEELRKDDPLGQIETIMLGLSERRCFA